MEQSINFTDVEAGAQLTSKHVNRKLNYTTDEERLPIGRNTNRHGN